MSFVHSLTDLSSAMKGSLEVSIYALADPFFNSGTGSFSLLVSTT